MTTSKLFDTYIAEVAKRIQKGKPPFVAATISEFCEHNPEVIFHWLSALIRHYSDHDSQYHHACLVLTAESLQLLRYSLDRQRPWAIELYQDIEQFIAIQIAHGHIDMYLQNEIISILKECRLPISHMIKDAHNNAIMANWSEERLVDEFDATGIVDFFNRMINDGCSNPFTLMDLIQQQMQLAEPEEQVMLIAELAKAPLQPLQDIPALMLLHPDKQVRMGIQQLLAQQIIHQRLSSDSLRRMIGVRNWLPEQERKNLDKLIRTARLKGIECGAWPSNHLEVIYASEIDGSGTQGVLILIPDGKRTRLASFLLKQAQGIADAWITEPMTKHKINKFIREAQNTVNSQAIDIDYLNKVIPYFISIGLAKGNIPMPQFLQIAELAGISQWHAEPFDYKKEVQSLVRSAGKTVLNDETVEQVLQQSAHWPAQETFAASWFEDDAEVDKLLAKTVKKYQTKALNLTTLASHIRDSILENRRHIWGERLLLMALRAKFCQQKDIVAWQDFLILAKTLADGRSLSEIPLMNAISEETLMAAMHR